MAQATLSRYWHTLRHLKPRQVTARLVRPLSVPRPVVAAPPDVRQCRQRWQGPTRPASMTGPARFRFVGQEREIVTPDDWNRQDWPRLWLYNAHYFDDLAATDAHARSAWQTALILRWIDENPAPRGCGWEPYPTSLRIVNWTKWALSGHALPQAGIHSLAVQARLLRRRLEFHLLGNHLWANAKALVFAGAFFDGREADAWRLRGLELVRSELGEQILPDGGHFERSPMYHAIVLEDLLDLVQLNTTYPGLLDPAAVSTWRSIASRMLRWLHVMSHPDGGIAFFNDAALDVAPAVAPLADYADRQGIPRERPVQAGLEALPASGYFRFQTGPAVLIADAAPVGPDYIPGHAHADTLSFELSLYGERFIVNGGTSTYEPGPQRLRERGTAMHNTVVINDADSSEVWGSFRVARRATPRDVSWGSDQRTSWLEAAHDGYRRLPGRPTHARRWEIDETGLRVVDRIDGRFMRATSRLRFAPGVTVESMGLHAGRASASVGRAAWVVRGGRSTQVVQEAWHPRFGEAIPCQVLDSTFGDVPLETTLRWQ